MECQVEKLEHFRHILLFEFNTWAKAAEAASNISAVNGDAIGESMARKWFSRFKEDRFNISDTPRPGRPSWFDEDRLNMGGSPDGVHEPSLRRYGSKLVYHIIVYFFIYISYSYLQIQ